MDFAALADDLNWLATTLACGTAYDRKRTIRMLRAAAEDLKRLSFAMDKINGRDSHRTDEQARGLQSPSTEGGHAHAAQTGQKFQGYRRKYFRAT